MPDLTIDYLDLVGNPPAEAGIRYVLIPRSWTATDHNLLRQRALVGQLDEKGQATVANVPTTPAGSWIDLVIEDHVYGLVIEGSGSAAEAHADYQKGVGTGGQSGNGGGGTPRSALDGELTRLPDATDAIADNDLWAWYDRTQGRWEKGPVSRLELWIMTKFPGIGTFTPALKDALDGLVNNPRVGAFTQALADKLAGIQAGAQVNDGCAAARYQSHEDGNQPGECGVLDSSSNEVQTAGSMDRIRFLEPNDHGTWDQLPAAINAQYNASLVGGIQAAKRAARDHCFWNATVTVFAPNSLTQTAVEADYIVTGGVGNKLSVVMVPGSATGDWPAGAQVIQVTLTDPTVVNWPQIRGRPHLGTASSRDVGTATHNLVEVGSDGKLPASVLPPDELGDAEADFVQDLLKDRSLGRTFVENLTGNVTNEAIISTDNTPSFGATDFIGCDQETDSAYFDEYREGDYVYVDFANDAWLLGEVAGVDLAPNSTIRRIWYKRVAHHNLDTYDSNAHGAGTIWGSKHIDDMPIDEIKAALVADQQFKNDVRSPSDPYEFLQNYQRLADGSVLTGTGNRWVLNTAPTKDNTVQMEIQFATVDVQSAVERWLIGNEIVLGDATFELKDAAVLTSGRKYQAGVEILTDPDTTLPAVGASGATKPILQPDTPHRSEFGTAAFKDTGTSAGDVVEVGSDGKIDSSLYDGGGGVSLSDAVSVTGAANNAAATLNGSFSADDAVLIVVEGTFVGSITVRFGSLDTASNGSVWEFYGSGTDRLWLNLRRNGSSIEVFRNQTSGNATNTVNIRTAKL